MITIEELKEKLESFGYVATEELIFDTYNALCMFNDGKINSGQDIYAICLEGPPGAGKTEFAKTYTKICNELFDKNVEMVDYQCDATTGKTELFEDINISAAIRGDADNVNIPGKLVEAIKKVNSGKKVILFIDEYDKAREETDAFLLQFLQSGKINSTQHGDLEVKNEYKSNLQVILCKNDMREELSGPLSRRIRILRLDYMEPATFYKVANNVLVNNRKDKINDGLLNLVTLMYEHAYSKKEVYDRLPSCSEMLIALEDADRLLKRAHAPQYIIYKIIIKNMFKSPDDIKTFENSISDNKLNDLIKSMKNKENSEKEEDINTLIATKVFVEAGKQLKNKADEMQNLIDEYKIKFNKMEENRLKAIEAEKKKILLENGKLVSSSTKPNVIKNFEDESASVKRGYDIFESSNDDWTNVASITIDGLSHGFLIENLVKAAHKLDIKIYENGILLNDKDDIKLILVNTIENNKSVYKVMCDKNIIPSIYLSDINNLIKFANAVYQKQYKTAHKMSGNYSINTLIYNDTKFDETKFDNVLSEGENVYYIEKTGKTENLDDLENCILEFSSDCSNDFSKVHDAIKKLTNEKKKVLTNE